MISGALFLFSITLSVMVIALCAMIYTRQNGLIGKAQQHQDMLLHLETALDSLVARQSDVYKRLEQLSSDVLQREIYQNADERHQLAVESARQGKGLSELAQLHGLSTDEAALLVSLHAPRTGIDDVVAKNANLRSPAATDTL